jgi:small GTP-binding protein
MRDSYVRTAQAFILVYSITDPSSFQEIETIHEQLLRSVDSDSVPLVLVGNKCDLEDERGVSKDEGEKLAKELGGCNFFESSAKERINIEECFFTLVRLLNYEENDCQKSFEKNKVENRKGKKACIVL